MGFIISGKYCEIILREYPRIRFLAEMFENVDGLEQLPTS